MIQANELRIGNLVDDGFENIIEINIDSYREILVFDANTRWKGIKLNEEWFLKFGFKNTIIEKLNFQEYKISNLCFAKVGGDHSKYQLSLFGKYYAVYIEYVHQLQNLYFALTNEELQIEL
jgi:hypothetical protein